MFDIEDFVEPRRHVESQRTHLQAFTSAVDIGEPALVGKRVLQLIAVIPVLWCREYRLHRRCIHLTEACESFVYARLLVNELCGIIHVLPFAPPAHTEMVAERWHTVLR